MVKKTGAGDIAKQVRKLISDVSEIPLNELKDDAKFTEDMGVDSMKALEIVAAVEKKFKIVIPEEKIPAIRTPNDVYDILQKVLKI